MWLRLDALWRRQNLVVAVLVAALGGAAYALGSGGDFYADDFLNARIGHDMGLTSQWLLLNIFSHFGPGMRFADWAAQRFLPFDYRLTLAISVLVYVLTLVAFYRLLRALVGPSRWLPVVVLLFGVSPLWFPSVAWWAGFNSLAGNLGVVVAMDGYVRHRRDRRVGHLLECVAGFAFALLFYEKPALFLLYAALLDLLLLNRGGLLAGLRGMLRAWPLWTGLLLVFAVFVGFYVHGHYYAASTGHPGVRTMLRFYGIAWARALVPGVVGGPLGWDWGFVGAALGRLAPPGWLVAVGELVVAAVVVAGLRRSRSAWRAWLFVALTFLAGLGLVGWGRIVELGVDAATDPRYLFDNLFLVYLGLAVVFLRPLPVAGAPDGSTAGEQAPRRWRPRLPAAMAAVAAALVLLGSVASALPEGTNWTDSDGSRYVHGLRAALPALGDASFYDRTVPAGLMIPQFYPYSRYSTVLWLLDHRLRFDAPDTAGHIVVGDGEPVAATLQHIAGAPGGCVPAGGELDLPLDHPPPAGNWLVTFRATSSTATSLNVGITTATGPGLGTPEPVGVLVGEHTYVGDLVPLVAPLAIRLVAPPGTAVCVTDLSLVQPVAQGGNP